MKINQIREEVLWDFINNTSDGEKRLARAALQILPFKQLKKLIEELDLEAEVVKQKEYWDK